MNNDKTIKPLRLPPPAQPQPLLYPCTPDTEAYRGKFEATSSRALIRRVAESAALCGCPLLTYLGAKPRKDGEKGKEITKKLDAAGIKAGRNHGY